MKLCVYSDPHWCTYSSIIRSRGERFSKRLENLIKSINWVEDLAKSHNCTSVFCLGDFFDKSELTAEELTALQSIAWSDLSHNFLVGNHEMLMNSLEYSSAHIFNLKTKAHIYTEPKKFEFIDFELCILPFIPESDRKTIIEYFGKKPNNKKRLIFSHNDLAGVNLGRYISETGFSLNDIDENCDLFINGHLHNSSWVSEKAFNLGNLTGQNFSEDAFKYEHLAIIIDTETLHIDYYENPYAFNFYKIDYTNADIDIINETDFKMKNNAVLTIKCTEEDSTYIRARYVPGCERQGFPHNCLVSECRLVIQPTIDKTQNKEIELNTIDHIKQFTDYCIATFGDTETLRDELREVVK